MKVGNDEKMPFLYMQKNAQNFMDTQWITDNTENLQTELLP